jgi:uncharacterized protein
MLLRPLRAFANAWREIDALRDPNARADARAITYLYIVATMSVTSIWIGNRGFYYDTASKWLPPSGEYHGLFGDLWWVGMCVLSYFVVPAIAVKWTGGSLRAHGLSPRGFVRHLPLYLGLYALVLPAVLIASTQHNFVNTYPLSSDAQRAWAPLLIFEAGYALQFFALEFFFRGFMLFGLVRYLGVLVIPVMLVPYALIHFGKPLPEALGAILAGTVLGTLALRTGSIWGGVFIHYAVALTMDLLALWRKGAFLFT